MEPAAFIRSIYFHVCILSFFMCSPINAFPVITIFLPFLLYSIIFLLIRFTRNVYKKLFLILGSLFLSSVQASIFTRSFSLYLSDDLSFHLLSSETFFPSLCSHCFSLGCKMFNCSLLSLSLTFQSKCFSSFLNPSSYFNLTSHFKSSLFSLTTSISLTLFFSL